MASVADYYLGSLLAQAAYGDFSNADQNHDGVYDERRFE